MPLQVFTTLVFSTFVCVKMHLTDLSTIPLHWVLVLCIPVLPVQYLYAECLYCAYLKSPVQYLYTECLYCAYLCYLYNTSTLSVCTVHTCVTCTIPLRWVFVLCIPVLPVQYLYAECLYCAYLCYLYNTSTLSACTVHTCAEAWRWRVLRAGVCLILWSSDTDTDRVLTLTCALCWANCSVRYAQRSFRYVCCRCGSTLLSLARDVISCNVRHHYH